MIRGDNITILTKFKLIINKIPTNNALAHNISPADTQHKTNV